MTLSHSRTVRWRCTTEPRRGCLGEQDQFQRWDEPKPNINSQNTVRP